MDSWLLFLLILIGVPFVLPIVTWVSGRRTRTRVSALESALLAQQAEITRLTARLTQLQKQDVGPEPSMTAAAAPKPPVERPWEDVAITPAASRQDIPQPPVSPAPPVPAVERPWAEPPAARPSAPEVPPPPRPRPPVPAPPQPPSPPFDWEGLVGVKLFSAIAGIALVIAAVFFLRYSIEHGWLQPPVRVLIGVAVAVSLLIVCELKAARQYPATANAMDAAAIAILFATFFAAHALWNLIPAGAAFALLGIVTALAVLLSIRRESLFIAVLGLLGGFSTPALLSTGENRPIPLFAYLMLLNVGLAWVAYRKKWPLLTTLTLVLTTVYQWGWVLKFLNASSVPLAMGIFLIFPVVTVAGLMLARRAPQGPAQDEDVTFEYTAMLAAALPLLFAVYLAAVPEYGARPELLLGFLLLVDAGLLAVALARRREVMHAAGAVVTVLAVAVWLAVSYTQFRAPMTALGFVSAFVVLYLCAPILARGVGRAFEREAASAQFAAPTLLFVFPALAAVEPAFVDPGPLFGTLLMLVLAIAWRAIAARRGSLYHLAAFFAIAAQAIWSAKHLTVENLATAVALYAVFGVVSIGVPMIARQTDRTLQPEWGSGAVLIVSIGLLLFLSAGPIGPAALWALALLLGILNAGLFVESAAGGLPVLSVAGSLVSWVILAHWWTRAAASVGVLPSLVVLTGLTLVTLAGHAWAHGRIRDRHASPPAKNAPSFGRGLYLGLIGHAFLLFLVMTRQWAIPPWPVFGTLAVVTLATTAASLFTRAGSLHAAGVIAAAAVIAVWTATAGAPPYGSIGIAAAGVISAYALGVIFLGRRAGINSRAAVAAGLVLVATGITTIVAVNEGGAPPFPLVVAAHALSVGVLLALTWVQKWRYVAVAAVGPAWIAVEQWRSGRDLTTGWSRLLTIGVALYAIFIAYPVILGRRARGERDPYLAAVAASAMLFFAGRAALLGGGFGSMVGVLPIAEGAVLALLLRQLLHIEPAGKRDLGRLALIAGAALAFVTVAIPLQLEHQWITIGWAVEGAALTWVFRRIPHRGLLYWAVALLGAVFVRLALNPWVLHYQQRGSMRIFNWYLYTYVICAAAFLLAAWWLSRTDEQLGQHTPVPSHALSAGAIVLLFIVLNIEIADFYATGPTIVFRFGTAVSQDLTYTIGWLVFGMLLLAIGIYLKNRPARITAVALIAVTTFKCFLYDLASLGGLYRVASFVGLAMSLALVSLALQKFVLSRPKEAA